MTEEDKKGIERIDRMLKGVDARTLTQIFRASDQYLIKKNYIMFMMKSKLRKIV